MARGELQQRTNFRRVQNQEVNCRRWSGIVATKWRVNRLRLCCAAHQPGSRIGSAGARATGASFRAGRRSFCDTDSGPGGTRGREQAAIRAVLRQIETVAPTDSTALICGETGTGKELVARAIHERSARSSNAFVKLNCAAIPTGTAEPDRTFGDSIQRPGTAGSPISTEFHQRRQS